VQVSSSPERVMFSQAGLTKLDLTRCYADVAGVMVPHLRDRPLALESFPRGVGSDGYFVNDAPGHFPDWIPRVAVPKREGGTIHQVLANDAATLVYLAGQNAITPHTSLTVEFRRDRRGERIFIDIARDAYGQHSVAPYALRARPNAPVATPLHRHELDDRRLDPQGWNAATIRDRLADGGDPWHDIARPARTLAPAHRALTRSAKR
jgi:DNA primase